MARYLLDANWIIALYDPKAATSSVELRHIKTEFKAILENPDASFSITPLIRYEVSRGIVYEDKQRRETLEKALNGFEEFDIGRDIADLAANIFRFDRSQEQHSLDKRQFDVLHYACAKTENLKLLSRDKHMEKIAELHAQIT